MEDGGGSCRNLTAGIAITLTALIALLAFLCTGFA